MRAGRRLEEVPTFLGEEDEDTRQRKELAQLERRRHEVSQKLKEIENKERNLTQSGYVPPLTIAYFILTS